MHSSSFSPYKLTGVLIPLLLSATTSWALPSPDNAPIDVPTPSQVVDEAGSVNPEGYVLAIALIVSGIFMAFFGARLVRFAVMLAGAYLGLCVAVLVTSLVEPAAGFSNPRLVYTVAMIVCAVVGAFVFSFFIKIGLAAIGAFGGYTLALFLLTLRSGGLIHSQVGQLVFIIGLAIIGAILIFWAERQLIRVGTSIGGSYVTFVGLDYFVKSGFKEAAVQFLGHPSTGFETSGKVYGMVAGVVVMSVVAIFVQYKKTARHYHGIAGK
ncbi:hypothetical protein BC828DRAFT_390679 [Blastocladiella britannica]|nr:hypothetical protein BC828DRAFT_390679 [Blastocladiella britannica]